MLFVISQRTVLLANLISTTPVCPGGANMQEILHFGK